MCKLTQWYWHTITHSCYEIITGITWQNLVFWLALWCVYSISRNLWMKCLFFHSTCNVKDSVVQSNCRYFEWSRKWNIQHEKLRSWLCPIKSNIEFLVIVRKDRDWKTSFLNWYLVCISNKSDDVLMLPYCSHDSFILLMPYVENWSENEIGIKIQSSKWNDNKRRANNCNAYQIALEQCNKT